MLFSQLKNFNPQTETLSSTDVVAVELAGEDTRRVTLDQLSDLVGGGGGGSDPTGDPNAVAFFDSSGDLDSDTGFTLNLPVVASDDYPFILKLDKTVTPQAGNDYPGLGGALIRFTATDPEVAEVDGLTVSVVSNSSASGSLFSAGTFGVTLSGNDASGFAYGISTNVNTSGAAAYGEAIGLLVQSMGANSVTAEGILIQDISGADSNYAIKTGAGKVTLGDVLEIAAGTADHPQIHLAVGVAPTSPSDGDIWLESNTNTGLKIRINGVTKTITLG